MLWSDLFICTCIHGLGGQGDLMNGLIHVVATLIQGPIEKHKCDMGSLSKYYYYYYYYMHLYMYMLTIRSYHRVKNCKVHLNMTHIYIKINALYKYLSSSSLSLSRVYKDGGVHKDHKENEAQM